MTRSSDQQTKRLVWVGIFIIVLALLLLGKTFSLQILRNDEFTKEADRSYVQSSGIFDRGTIFLTSKDGTLMAGATVIRGYLLAVDPGKIENADEVYASLEPFLVTTKKEDFLKRATKQNDPYEEIEKRIERERADAIKKLGIPGVYLYEDTWRYYPGEGILSNVLGFVAYKEDSLEGQYGLERYYNDILSRRKEQQKVNNFAQVFSHLGSSFFSKDNPEGDVVTTIETRVQQYLEQTLSDTLETWNADSGFGIIMNPQTGEIYAMTALPSYNNNEFGKVEDISLFRNPLVENVYEFGSVVKPLVVAGALDMGAITSETEYYDAGFIQVEDATIKNFDEKGRGQVTVNKILADSLNTGMVFIMQQMGREKFKEYMLSYGIGERTGIDLPSEVKGLVKNLETGGRVEYATSSFGQGISTSPIALARALSTLGNGGYLIQPHIVKKIDYKDMEDKEFIYPKEEKKQVFSADTSHEITKILVSIVDETLGEGSYAQAGYTVAAKTGTAQIPNPTGGYYQDRNRHSFFGYFPAYDPQFIVVLSINHPKGVKYASQTLSSPFFDITDFIIRYYNLPPDR